jgi:hypothetical protein
MLADDDFLGEDLEWATLTLAQRTSRGFRYRKTALKLLITVRAENHNATG